MITIKMDERTENNKIVPEHWLGQHWGSLQLDRDQVFPKRWAPFSNKKFKFICACGRTRSLVFANVTKGQLSCGACFNQARDYWLSQKWGKLRLDPEQELPEEWGAGSHIGLEFLCACERHHAARFYNITNGSVTSCGKCSWRGKNQWLAKKWGRLSLNSSQRLPDEWAVASNQKFLFDCDCGNALTCIFNNVESGNSTSCGRCTLKPKAYWLSQTWEGIKLDLNQELPCEWGGGSTLNLEFQCKCGSKFNALMYNVTSGHTKSCGKCSHQSKEYWLSQRWGCLRVLDTPTLPERWGLERPTVFVCTCGSVKPIYFPDVISGHTQSCGSCKFETKAYWLSQTWGKLKLDPNQDLPEEWGRKSSLKLGFICDCTNPYSAVFYSVTDRLGANCGCQKRGTTTTSPAYVIYEFVKSMASDAQFSFWVKTSDGTRRELDVYIPSKRLGIEYHGLIWHSEKFTEGAADYKKMKLLQQEGIRVIQVYGDEWEEKQEVAKALIQRSILPLGKRTRIRPTYSVVYTTPKEARTFLDTHHYLGAASQTKGKGLTITAEHGGAIVGVWVFMKRETGVILWHRACWHPNYKAWNPHEKALALALPELKKMGFTKMLTFSDNRFHTGQLYEKLGFKFEKEIPPDYGYVRGAKRKCKYALRVKAGVNEKAEAESKGWYRIWDSGKRRFSLDLSVTLCSTDSRKPVRNEEQQKSLEGG